MTAIHETQYAALKAKLAIDMLRFDQELIEIAQLVQEAAELSATMTALRDTAKMDLDTVTAMAASALRGVLDDKGKARSETTIASELPLVDKVQNARAALIEAEREMSIYRGLVEALKHKKEALRTLSEQMVAGFMTPTSLSVNARKEINEVRQAGIARRAVTSGT